MVQRRDLLLAVQDARFLFGDRRPVVRHADADPSSVAETAISTRGSSDSPWTEPDTNEFDTEDRETAEYERHRSGYLGIYTPAVSTVPRW